MRQQAGLPPYHYMAVVRAQASNQKTLLHFLHEVKKQVTTTDVMVLGPAPAPLARKADLHRMQLLVTSPSRKKRQDALTQMRQWLTMEKVGQGVRWNIDVDPMDLS